jgi:hypothetical protein
MTFSFPRDTTVSAKMFWTYNKPAQWTLYFYITSLSGCLCIICKVTAVVIVHLPLFTGMFYNDMGQITINYFHILHIACWEITKLSTCRKVLTEKLTVAQPTKVSSSLMEPAKQVSSSSNTSDLYSVNRSVRISTGTLISPAVAFRSFLSPSRQLSIWLVTQIRQRTLPSWSRDSVVGIVTGYGPDDRRFGVRVPVRSRIFSSPRLPDRLRGQPNLLSNRYLVLFPRELSGRGVKLTTHLQLVPRSRKCGSTHPLPHTFHGVVLN